jgi:hypothetical protein
MTEGDADSTKLELSGVPVPWEEFTTGQPEWLAPIFDHLRLHNEYLIQETDRAAGVLASAFLDSVLIRLLRHVLRDGEAKKNLFRSEGPLGTYSARLDLANALGLISDETRSDLRVLGTIRNKFAHSVDVHAFEHPQIKELCARLKAAAAYEAPGDPRTAARTAFLLTVLIMSADIANGLRYATPAQGVPTREGGPGKGKPACHFSRA